MLGPADRTFLLATGRDPQQVEAALTRLRGGAAWTRLQRPATRGDGIRVLEPAGADVDRDLARAAAASGRLSAFVPASGAGSRLFEHLMRAWTEGLTSIEAMEEAAASGATWLAEPLALLGQIDTLALWPELARRGASPRDVERVLHHLFAPGSWEVQSLPKGLLPFHAYPEGARTAFEEQVVESARLLAAGGGRCRLHMTVSAERLADFEALREEVVPRVQARLGVRVEVSFSAPDPATDMPAIEEDGQPLRDEEGRLVFRPGGHGGLLGDLERAGLDLALLKNVDNVFPEPALAEILPHRSRVAGVLVGLEARVHAAIHALRAGGGLDEAIGLLEAELGLAPPDGVDRHAWALDRLDRPLRVCGMIPNKGQPGGGPFWVLDEQGLATLQIVEGAQVDGADPEQRALLAGSTHFNPVDVAVSLRDAYGSPFSLRRFVDPDSIILTVKSHEGRRIRVIEHPGLWNGGMARWNTVFVELPLQMFNPVKRLGDLLLPSHRLG